MAYSVLQSLISFWAVPWYCLVCCMRAIATTWRNWCVTSIRFTIHIVMVSYQYRCSLCYLNIHRLMFIGCYFTSIYKKYIILLCFIFNRHNNWLISKNLYQFLCNIFKHNFLLQTSTSKTFQEHRSPTHSKHWKTEIYRGSDYRGEVDRDSVLNHLASVILRQYTTVTNQC